MVGDKFDIICRIDILSNHTECTLSTKQTAAGAPVNSKLNASWRFDLNTKFYICAEINGQTPLSCNVYSFLIWYTSYLNGEGIFFLGGLSRKFV